MNILLNEIEFPLLRLGSTDAIKQESLEILKIQKDFSPAYKDLAILAYLEGKYQDAEMNAQLTLKYHPSNIYAIKVLAEVCFDTRRFDDGLRYYQALIQVLANRKLPSEKDLLEDAFSQIADHYVSVGLLSKAIECYQSIVRVWPENENANIAIVELNKPEVLPLFENPDTVMHLPPPHLFYYAAWNTDLYWFIETGRSNCESFNKLLISAGLILDTSHKILDFGCAVGRVVRHWNLPADSIYGTDYNPDLIKWCKRYLPGNFSTNPLAGRTRYCNQQFDFVYAQSVFTHLTLPAQQFWIEEFYRILKPGGFLLLTLHGDNFVSQLSDQQKEEYGNGKMIVWDQTREGTNHCAVFHPHQYVREKMFGASFEILSFVPGDTEAFINQDIYLLKKRNCLNLT